MEIQIPCNVPRCNEVADEFVYCQKHFEGMIEDAREEGREEERKKEKSE